MRNWIDLFESHIDFDGPPYTDEDGEIDTGACCLAIIDAVQKFAAPLPIRVEMIPYRNSFTKDIQGVTLTDFYADNPGDGYGTKVMNLLCGLADQASINLFTDPEGPRSKAFYEKFGFERNTHGTPLLIRYAPLPDWFREDD